jgi:hypothetical protein
VRARSTWPHLPADGATGLETNSRDGLTIIATMASGPIEAADTIVLRLSIIKYA